MKRFFTVFLVAVLILSLAACGTDKDKASETTAASTSAVAEKLDMVYAQIEMENGGVITLELDPNVAPITVANFKSLAESGFYNGLTFHRISKGFMIQGGDPAGNGSGGSSQEIKGEFKKNGVNNTISHKRGVISMARSDGMNSASSQFFICDADSTYLDGKYAAFGHVIDGLDVVDEIANTPVIMNAQGTEKSVPTVKVIMKEVRIIDAPDAATTAE